MTNVYTILVGKDVSGDKTVEWRIRMKWMFNINNAVGWIKFASELEISIRALLNTAMNPRAQRNVGNT
jgi:hypothetical protein